MTSTQKQKAAAEKAPEAPKVVKIKYMGASTTRIIEKGDKIGGALVNGVPSTVTWELENHHIADITDWTADQIDALVSYGDEHEFIDVTDKERVAPSLGQQMWQAVKPNAKLEQDEVLPEPQKVEDVDLGPSGAGLGTQGDAGTAVGSAQTPA